ncbi:protein rep [Rhodobacter sp. 24-YEA-8]|uniref:protein rep n=1 Tax=Rhodobacter sp. 24-YEA-8 TaxID=1884310 RepID=UPI001160093F|nr:protein rep [Rhodobacter sp. 24-YEA-8]
MRKAPPKGKPKARKCKNPERDKAKKAEVFRDLRRQVHADQRAVAGLVQRHVRHDHRIGKCKWCKIAAKVELHLNSYGEGSDAVQRASYKGLVICGNVWGCPVCGARVSRVRRGEMNTLLAWAREQKLVPVMLTLTARHGRADRLADLLEGMKNAKRRLRQRAEWRALPYAGSVTATEITHGTAHGWHPHFHEIVLLRCADEAEALAMVQPLAEAWRVSLRAFDLDGAAAAFDAQGAAVAGDYVTKWGVAAEMTLRDSKAGRAGKAGAKGRIPLELARLAAAGGNCETHLWLEYFEATSGQRRRQLVWSRGLKAECGVAEVADEAAAAQESEDGQISEPVFEWGVEWSAVARKRVRMMEAAEIGGAAAVAVAMAGRDDDEAEASPKLVETAAAPANPHPTSGGNGEAAHHDADTAGDEMLALLALFDAPPDVQAAADAARSADFRQRAGLWWEKVRAAA